MTQAADVIRNQRQHFAAPGGSHDRLIKFLATALPAGIGLVAAIMILSPLSQRGEISFLLDRNKVEIAPERVRVANATYRGRDKQGRPFVVEAGSAAQLSADEPQVTLEKLVATLQLADGPAQISAPGGVYNFDANAVSVSGPVLVTAPDGYRLSARGVSINLRTRHVTGAGGIEGEVPTGTFSANRIDADLVERTVSLVGQARLRMAPGKLRMPG